MVESVTAHYAWTKPEVTKSASTWGGFLNTDLDSIDALVFANQQGIVPIGSITMFAGATAPANWLICDGRSLDTTAYAALFAVLQYVHGGSGSNFNLPNLTNRFPMGAGTLAATGGEATHTLTAAEIATHTHTATQPAHTHTATQPAHTHPDPGHTHGVNDPGHLHSAPVSFPAGVNFQAGSGFTPVTANTSVNNTGISIAGSATGLGSAGADPITVVANSAGAITVAANTGGGAHNNLPPFVALNFIIRAA